MPESIDPGDKHITQAYGISILSKKSKLVKELNKYHEPSVHGDKNWLSSFVIADYLLHNPVLKKRSKVLELGCGWGPASVFCARHANCKVTGLDIDKDVFPYLEAQADINGVEIATQRGKFEKLNGKYLGNFDVLIGADICFWDELHETLYKLIKRAVKNGVKDIIIADPGRSPFLELVDRCEKILDTEYLGWYCTEPERFDGYLMHIRNHRA